MSDEIKSMMDVPAPEVVPAIEPKWYLDEGIPGIGDRPDYLEPKYKTMADQARSYKDLQKALGATSGSPDEYDFGNFKDVIDIGNQHLQEYVNYAKQNRISQEAFNKTLDTFVNYQKSFQPNMSEEVAKLGPDGAMKIDTVRRWAENNLSEQAIQTVGKIATSAEVINFLDEMRQFQFHASQQPPGSTSNAGDFTPLTVAEVEAEMQQNYKLYNSDPRYRAEIQRKFEQAVG